VNSRVAVLMTCFNRRETTIRSLDGLAGQQLGGVQLEVFLVDDGSSDGTAAAVRASFPAVTVIHGTGELYWTGGTCLADAEAWTNDPDYILWLNDDVHLDVTAVRTLVDAAASSDNRSIIVGACVDPETGAPSYGGYRRTNPRRPIQLSRVAPSGQLESLDTMNGNVVLIPSEVRRSIGPLDRRFSHNMADLDYGFRARRAGWGVTLAPRFVGTCLPNPSKAKWREPAFPLRERVRAVISFRGLPPKEWLVFTRRYCGWRWPRYFISPYVRTAACRWLR
jgi:GT2 family glycosyltransferase